MRSSPATSASWLNKLVDGHPLWADGLSALRPREGSGQCQIVDLLEASATTSEAPGSEQGLAGGAPRRLDASLRLRGPSWFLAELRRRPTPHRRSGPTGWATIVDDVQVQPQPTGLRRQVARPRALTKAARSKEGRGCKPAGGRITSASTGVASRSSRTSAHSQLRGGRQASSTRTR